MPDHTAPTVCMLLSEHLSNHYVGPLARGAAICLAYLHGPQVRIANAGAVSPMVRTGHEVRVVDIGGLRRRLGMLDVGCWYSTSCALS